MFDVPENSLSQEQKLQLFSHRQQKILFDKDEVSDFLNSLWYPLCFLDFETFMSAIPKFEGTRPYQTIPFQYSLHFLEEKGGDLKHREYLSCLNTDPREELISKLVDDIPDGACVLAYNKTFEESVLRNLASQFPAFKKKIDSIISNLRDLMNPFSRMHVYSWEQHGSYSLKKVLPAVAPGLSHSNLAIKDGDMAMSAYPAMLASNDQEEIDRIRKALLEYCQLDTMAMVHIYNELCDGFSQREHFDYMDVLDNVCMQEEMEAVEAKIKGFSEDNTLLLYGLESDDFSIFETLAKELHFDIYDVDTATDLIAVPSFMAFINPKILSESDVDVLFQWFDLLNEVKAIPPMPIYFTRRPAFELPERHDGFMIKIIEDLNEKYCSNLRVEINKTRGKLIYR